MERWYTPQMLAKATGLGVSTCRHLIAQSADKICVSQNPNSERKRYAISESGFAKLVAQTRRQSAAEQAGQMQQSAQDDRKAAKRREKPIPGFNPDGTIMNSRQLKEAGLWPIK